MGAQTKVAGTWRDMTAPYIKVSGAWNIAKSAWTKLDGQWRSWFLQGGVLDKPLGGEDELRSSSTPFTTNTGLGTGTGQTNSIAIQSDGKILVGGNFTTWDGVAANRIVRLNSDGTLDTAFTRKIGTAANLGVDSIAIQSDGKILIGGQFTTFNEDTVNRIVRLNSDGTRDTTFTTNTGTGGDGRFRAIAVQSDGKILLGGGFTTFNGTTVNRIVRLNSDGTRDTAFTTNTGTALNSNVWSIATQSDGKILLGGEFSTFNGTTVNGIVRLNSDGTRDTAFTTNTGTAGTSVLSIAIQSDGKIVIGGSVTTFNGTTVNRIARLSSDGVLDTTFTTNTGTGASGNVLAIATQSDGKIILGGEFTTFNGTTVNRIVRLNSDGTRDTTFTTNTGTAANNTVNAIAVQSDGKIVIGGSFATFNGTTVTGLARLSSAGTIEPAPGASSDVLSIATQSDGKFLIGGDFTTFSGTTVNRIARLNADGTLDTAFTTNTGTGVNGTVRAIALQSDGKIVIVGSFTTFNGTTVNRIVRLNSDGTRDTAFTTNTGTGSSSDVYALAIQSDGKIVIGGTFLVFNGTTTVRIARLSSDGVLETAFNTNIGTGASDIVYAIAIQSDGKILLGGDFTTFNGTTVNRIARLSSAGVLETAFTTNIGTGASSTIRVVALQSDGKFLIGGAFTTFNGTTVNRIVRLNSDGTRDTTFTTNAGTGASGIVFSIPLQSDGKILLGGAFTTFNGTTVNRIARLSSAGVLETAFTINLGTGANGIVQVIATQSDGKILSGGAFAKMSGVPRFRVARIGGALAQ